MNKRYKRGESLPVWLTSKGSVVQHDLPNKVVTTTNQLLYSNGVVYIIPRGTVTDNYSIPLGINKSKYDVRPSHLHDIGCYYHKVLVVDLPLYKIDKYIDYKDGIKICMDIPIEYIKIIPVRFNQCNNLLYDGMRASTTMQTSCTASRLTSTSIGSSQVKKNSIKTWYILNYCIHSLIRRKDNG